MDQIIAEAKRIEEDTLYSAKSHFIMGNFWLKTYYWLGVPTALLAAVAGVSALSDFDPNGYTIGIISFLVAAITALNTFLNPQEKATIHKNTGNSFNSLRNRARIFHEIESQQGLDESGLICDLKKLNKERDRLNLESPHVYRWAFEKGRKGIEAGEANYQIDSKP